MILAISLVSIKVHTMELETLTKRPIRTWLEATPSTINNNLLHKKKRIKIDRKKEAISGPRKFQDCLVMMLLLNILKDQ